MTCAQHPDERSDAANGDDSALFLYVSASLPLPKSPRNAILVNQIPETLTRIVSFQSLTSSLQREFRAPSNVSKSAFDVLLYLC